MTTNPLVAVTPAGFQNNINYTRFSVAAVGPLNGLKTASPPNAAVLSARNDLTTPNSNALNPTATATKSPTIKYFSLLSFFFGCVEASAESTANTAVGCDRHGIRRQREHGGRGQFQLCAGRAGAGGDGEGGVAEWVCAVCELYVGDFDVDGRAGGDGVVV